MDTAGREIGGVKSSGNIPFPNRTVGGIIGSLVLALVAQIHGIAIKIDAAFFAAGNIFNVYLCRGWAISWVPCTLAGRRAA